MSLGALLGAGAGSLAEGDQLPAGGSTGQTTGGGGH